MGQVYVGVGPVVRSMTKEQLFIQSVCVCLSEEGEQKGVFLKQSHVIGQRFQSQKLSRHLALAN